MNHQFRERSQQLATLSRAELATALVLKPHQDDSLHDTFDILSEIFGWQIIAARLSLLQRCFVKPNDKSLINASTKK